MLVDISLYETPALFDGVHTFNRTGDMSHLKSVDMYKPYYEIYKNGEALHYAERKIQQVSKHLYKHFTSLERPSDKFKTIRKHIYEAIHIKSFIKAYNV